MPEKLLILATLGEVGFNSPLPLSVLSVIVGLGRKACWTTPLVLWTFLHFCVQILLRPRLRCWVCPADLKRT